MTEHTEVLMSKDRILDSLAVFGAERVRHGMQAFPRTPIGERENICECFVGRAWQTDSRYGTASSGFDTAGRQNWKEVTVLSWAYEHQTEMFHAIATDWLAQQDAIAEVTQPGLVRASL